MSGVLNSIIKAGLEKIIFVLPVARFLRTVQASMINMSFAFTSGLNEYSVHYLFK